jgi:hypothetical protein
MGKGPNESSELFLAHDLPTGISSSREQLPGSKQVPKECPFLMSSRGKWWWNGRHLVIMKAAMSYTLAMSFRYLDIGNGLWGEWHLFSHMYAFPPLDHNDMCALNCFHKRTFTVRTLF